MGRGLNANLTWLSPKPHPFGVWTKVSIRAIVPIKVFMGDLMKYRDLFVVLAFFAASNRWLQAAAAVTTTDVTAGTALSATTHNTNFGNVRTALNKLNPNGWTNGGRQSYVACG